MKKILLIFVVMFTFIFQSNAQNIDLKISPLALTYKKVEISGEYGIKPNMGLELGLEKSFKRNFDLGEGLFTLPSDDGSVDEIEGTGKAVLSHISVYAHMKWYFKSDAVNDGFNLGAYLRYKNRTGTFVGVVDGKSYDTKISWPKVILGGTIGYKHVYSNNIIFGLTSGLGFAISSNLDSGVPVVDDAVNLIGFFRLNYFGQLSIGYRFADF